MKGTCERCCKHRVLKTPILCTSCYYERRRENVAKAEEHAAEVNRQAAEHARRVREEAGA